MKSLFKKIIFSMSIGVLGLISFLKCIDELNIPPTDLTKTTVTIKSPDGKIDSSIFKIGEQIRYDVKITYPKNIDSLIVNFGESKNSNNIFKTLISASTNNLFVSSLTMIYQESGEKRIIATIKFKGDTTTLRKSDTTRVNIGTEPKIQDKLIKCLPNQAVLGLPCTLSVDVVEYGNVEYNWIKNNNFITTNARKKYIVNSVSVLDSGIYRCITKNYWGTDTSRDLRLSINLNPKPQIISQPKSIQITIGKTASFNCVAIPENSKYQWFKNGSPIANETSSNCIIQSVKKEDDGAKFKCRVSNDNGVVESDEVTLSIFDSDQKPTIIQHPANIAIMKGEKAKFIVTAKGTNIAYQWQKNQSDIANAIDDNLQTDPVTEADNGAKFRCKVSNAAGTDISQEAVLTVISSDTNSKPQITLEPSDVEVTEGSSAIFKVEATGKDLKYQWKCNENAINGATASFYTISGVTKSDNGKKFKCILSNLNGSVNSRDANLKVVDKIEKPIITKQPDNQIVIRGNRATFQIEVTGANPSFQWKKGDADIPNATSNSYTTDTLGKTDNNLIYKCLVKNSAGEILSNPATVTVHWPPSITKHPENQKVKAGDRVKFAVEVEKGNPGEITYEWKDNNGNLKSTAQECSFDAGKEDNNKSYKCFVKNKMINNTEGTVESNTATISVFFVEITQQPQTPSEITVGGNFSLTVKAEANPTPQYEWKKDGSIVGTNSESFSVSQAQLSNSGTYKCRIFNSENCEKFSNEVVVTVKDKAPVIKTHPKNAQVILPDPNGSSNVSFEIFADGTNLKYKWNGLSNSSTSKSMSTTVNKSNDGSSVTCVVSNSAGEVTSNPAQVSVLWPPKVLQVTGTTNVKEGEMLSLRASIQPGNPSSYQYRWMCQGALKNSGSSSGSEITYSNQSAKTNDNGSWTCQVSNSAGSKEGTIYVTVKAKSKVVFRGPIPNQNKVTPNEFDDIRLSSYFSGGEGTLQYSLAGGNVTSNYCQIKGDIAQFITFGVPSAGDFTVSFKATDSSDPSNYAVSNMISLVRTDETIKFKKQKN